MHSNPYHDEIELFFHYERILLLYLIYILLEFHSFSLIPIIFSLSRYEPKIQCKSIVYFHGKVYRKQTVFGHLLLLTD